MKIHITASGYARILTTLLLFGCLLQGCMTPDKDTPAADSGSITIHIDKVKKDLEPLNFQTPPPSSERSMRVARFWLLTFSNQKQAREL
jgi:hypothetical protein